MTNYFLNSITIELKYKILLGIVELHWENLPIEIKTYLKADAQKILDSANKGKRQNSLSLRFAYSVFGSIAKDKDREKLGGFDETDYLFNLSKKNAARLKSAMKRSTKINPKDFF